MVPRRWPWNLPIRKMESAGSSLASAALVTRNGALSSPSSAASNTFVCTAPLRRAATAIGAASGITAADISVRSLRSAGAMALLCANVDPDRIRLLGRWRSDEMFRYLTVQAFPILAPFAAQMVHHGGFALLPNNHLPIRG
jgi:hypothetical protein